MTTFTVPRRHTRWHVLAAASACLLALSSLATRASTTAPIVPTESGLVQGMTQGGVQQFQGMAYAAPPVGTLRWRAPQAPQTWQGVRPATSIGPSCPQVATPYHHTATSEDCLYLNVYAPEPTPAQASALRPVMVWIHPGGLAMGAGSDQDGASLARRTGTVVVTLNHRLGVLGFMSSRETQQESGNANYGLQDQQQALRWVRANIRAFGGDPGRVTVLGNSAGSFSTCLHLASPASAGLFHRAILQSGPCIRLGAQTLAQARDRADEFAAKVNCPAGAGQLACLRSLSPDALIAASPDGLDTLRVANPWGPVADGTLLPGRVSAAIRDGQFNRVPVLLGTTADEGRFVGYSFHQQAGRVMTEDDYITAAATMTGSALSGSLSRTLYPTSTYASPDLATAALNTDAGFACPALIDAKRLSRHVPVFAYEFTDTLAPGPSDPFFSWGAYHTAELQYLFGAPTFITDVTRPMSSGQNALADTMVAYWAAFAAQGDPNGGNRPSWPRFNELLTPIMNLAPGAIRPQAWGAFQKAHRCTTWSLLFALNGDS